MSVPAMEWKKVAMEYIVFAFKHPEKYVW